MPAAQYDFTIEQGTTHTETFVWEDPNGVPVNLAGYKARMQARKTVTSPDKLIDATTENGLLVVTPAAGKIEFKAPATLTATFAFSQARYDLELESADGTVYRLVEGAITISKEVTRA